MGMLIRVLQSAPPCWTGAVLCLLLIAEPLSAEPRTEKEVAAAVETWLQGVITDARADATVEWMEPHVVDGETVAYIVHLEGEGFCLSGADDLVLPVYFYSPEGVYDPDNPSYEYILWEIDIRLAGLRKSLAKGDPGLETQQDALLDRALFWDDLAARQVPQRRGDAGERAEPDMMVIPFTPRWGQGSPYNDQCPGLPGPPYEPPPNDGRSKVGCVATAMAQIMYYWKWPYSGTGSRGHTWYRYVFEEWESATLQDDPGISSATWAGRLDWTDAFNPPVLRMGGNWDYSIYKKATKISNDPAYLSALAALWSRAAIVFQIVEADFSTATYDWHLMEDKHTDADGVGGGDAEVANLCFHAGVAVRMNWGRYLSLAQTSEVAHVLPTYFRYDPDAIFAYLNVLSMTTEIQWLRPFEIRGENSDGDGHAWVVYGYDKSTDPDRIFMMNLGWGGSSNGWYSLDDINLDYWADQKHVTRIAPKSVVGFVGSDAASSDGSPGTPYHNLADAAANAPDGATLIFKAGRDDTFAGGSLVVDRPFTLKGYDVTISHE
ncbi:MAG: C10 family peptidase [Phycisphaerales bacterium]|nr:MAG: C10 family peptidase [Phycisphaerales bacterium]